MEIKGGSVDFLSTAYVYKTAHAAPARRIKLVRQPVSNGTYL